MGGGGGDVWRDKYVFVPRPPEEFLIFYFTAGNSPDKAKLNPWIFHKIVLALGNSPGLKQRALEIPHYFFLVILLEILLAISLIPLEIPYPH